MKTQRLQRMPKNLPREKGFTLVELIVVIGIMAIIAAVAIPKWVQEIQQENRVEAIDNSRSAIQQLSMTALSSGGAVLTVSYNSNATTYGIASTASNVSVNYTIHAPSGSVLYLNNPTASVVSCFALDGKGFPVTAGGCSAPSSLAYPLSWSVSYAGQTVPISVQ